MADYNTATLDDITFQRNTPSGVSWRKRYVKENGGEWTSTDGTWSWSGGVVKTVKTPAPKPAVKKVVTKELD